MRPKQSLLIRLGLACGSLALIFLLSGWSLPLAPKAQSTAFVRIIHASPDVGIVDVFVNGNKFLSSFQFATVTGYVPLPANSQDVQIALLGQGTHAAMLTQSLHLQANEVYTIAVLGTKATGFSLTTFTDDNMITGNAAKIRIYHLSPGTGSVNIVENNRAFIQGLSYPQVSSYISLPVGQHTFSLDAASQNANEAFTATLKPWMITSIFALGELHGDKKFQFVTAQVQGEPQLPSTGSDPNAQISPSASAPSMPLWLVGLLLFLTIGGGAGIYWWGVARRPKHASSC